MPGASSFFPRACLGRARLRLEDGAERRRGLREPAARGEDPAEVEAGGPARDVVAAARRRARRVPPRGARRGRGRAAPSRSRSRSGSRRSGRSCGVRGRASRARGRSRPRRRAAPRGGSPRGATPRPRVTGLVERLGAQGEEATPLARGRGRPARRRGAPETPRRGASRARRARCGARAARRRRPSSGGAGSSSSRAPSAVAALEPERAGGEAGRHVEEVVGGDVALEERDGLVAAARRGESARGEVVEAAVRVALGGRRFRRVEPLEDLGPFSGARRGREVALARPASRRARGGGEESEEARGRRSGRKALSRAATRRTARRGGGGAGGRRSGRRRRRR